MRWKIPNNNTFVCRHYVLIDYSIIILHFYTRLYTWYTFFDNFSHLSGYKYRVHAKVLDSNLDTVMQGAGLYVLIFCHLIMVQYGPKHLVIKINF